MPLTNTAVGNAKPRDKPYKLNDGFDLYLLIHPNGGRYWRMDYRFAEKRKLSIGVYPAVSVNAGLKLCHCAGVRVGHPGQRSFQPTRPLRRGLACFALRDCGVRRRGGLWIA